MPEANLLNEVPLLDELVGFLEVNGGRVSVVEVGEKIFHLRNPNTTPFRQVIKRLVKDDPRFVIRENGFIELLPHEGEQLRLDQCEFVVLDIETTGINAHWDRITEVAAFELKSNGTLGRVITEEFTTLVNPQRGIPRWITQFTGITDRMVARSPRFAEIVDQLLQFIGASVIVAHNAHFDINFLNSEINRVYGKRLSNPRLCTLQLSRKLFSELPNHKLHTIANHLDVGIQGRHRARGDALATAEILIRMLDLLDSQGIATLLEAQGYRRAKNRERIAANKKSP